MKNIFVDTNIIIDLIADRQPFSKHAIKIFKQAASKKICLFTSSHSIATSHYLLKRFLGEKELREVLLNLFEFITVIAVDVNVLTKGLRSHHKDFEDAVQIICALSIEDLDCIVTRNGKDFKKSGILILAPEELCAKL
ncbi:MAG: hypothetical protein RLY16_1396 [Bacteroidota bacterium]|jgi:predicted nucleic acid-binding protein